MSAKNHAVWQTTALRSKTQFYWGRGLIVAGVMISILVGNVACTPTLATRGQILDPEILASVKVGQSTRADVAETLGTPFETAAFDDKTWYYLGVKTEKESLFLPKIVERRAVAVVFDDEGVVQKIEAIDADGSARPIDPVSRQTPTYGRETTIAQQLLGNIGRPGRFEKQ